MVYLLPSLSSISSPRSSLRDDAVDAVVLVDRLLGRAGDDERRPRLVDQDRVDLVDDREVVAALHHRREVELHVVAQVVEAELVVGAVGDVGRRRPRWRSASERSCWMTPTVSPRKR